MKNINQFIAEKFKITSKNIQKRDIKNWSIQNAQDGDIVTWCSGLIIFIYKCLNKGSIIKNKAAENAIVYHVAYIKNANELKIGLDTGVGSVNHNTNPKTYKLASEEECDILYKALEENGYEWDEIKLELIKI